MRHLIAVILLLVPAGLSAQGSASELPAGTRLRVWAAGQPAPMDARLHHASADSLVLADPAGNPSMALQSATIERLRADAGRPRALWTLGGMVAGATVGVLVTRASEPEEGDIGGVGTVADGLVNTSLGAIAGGVLGFTLAPRRWRDVRVSAP